MQLSKKSLDTSTIFLFLLYYHPDTSAGEASVNKYMAWFAMLANVIDNFTEFLIKSLLFDDDKPL